jgi:DNA-binding transcriptional LysR family regulator
MELRQLRHFQEIVRCSSFGQAAEKLNITQPALSKSIRNLERSLGLTLLERHPSGVTPTEYGRVFLETVGFVTSELDRAIEELNELKGRGRGVVRVGAGATMMRYLGPQAVKRFMAQPEGGSVVFRQGLRGELLAQLRRGEIDIVVGALAGETDDDLRHELIMSDQLAVVADCAHPLARSGPVELAELARWQWVLPDGPEAESDRLARAFKRAGLDGPRCAVRTQSSVFMLQLVRGSEYLSYQPRALLAADPDYAGLCAIEVAEELWPPVPVGVSYRRRGVMLQSTRRFINRLREAAADIATA